MEDIPEIEDIPDPDAWSSVAPAASKSDWLSGLVDEYLASGGVITTLSIQARRDEDRVISDLVFHGMAKAATAANEKKSRIKLAKEPERMRKIQEAIAAGATKMADISKISGVSYMTVRELVIKYDLPVEGRKIK